ncbi:ABC transporter permease [Mesorhizobium sp.]|uniref:ABC transporter permease n=1 Tax=Mesorhizobium sp. TaxID=1871066 RepID=UPI000FEA89CC|nr:ABC transporter permease [Mesorhizobium sp.]RWB68833.1 MAG: ABC transporter permease [Mesorhizobium sp.]RWF31722.1 MAG: ABC transporter permease [Mesorhizobium sp.]TIV78500.1 MAG: ABC transporter permease [Mesorhizobium sp.]TIV97100.1 MAG: ABC transporter permease [Mesorhizobium sp.]
MSSAALTSGKAQSSAFAVRHAGLFLPLLMVVFIIAFSILAPGTFASPRTAITLLRTESVSAILAIALLFPLIVGEFDLSVGANLGLSAILVTGLPSLQGFNLGIAIPVAIIACGTVGLINGLLVAKIGINALVATLGTSVIVTGSVFWYTDGNVIFSDIPEALPLLAQGNILGIPIPAYFLLGVGLAAGYTLQHTPLGRYFYAIGGSKDAARLSGLNVDNLTVLSFVIAGVLAGIAGVLQSALLGSGNPNVGPAFLLPAFAAAFLGATAIQIGRFNVLGTIIAVFTVAIGINGLQLLGVPFYVAPIFQGLSLIAAVSAARMLRGSRI